MRRNSIILIAISILLFTITSCKSSMDTVRQPGEKETKARDDTDRIPKVDSAFLSQHRSQLSDVYAGQQHDYPDIFKKDLTKEDENERVDYRGYRIQLVSTRNVSLVDSAQARFQQWLLRYPTTYKPKAYKLFHQPYYRLHIGDFQERKRAIRYSRLLKKYFPDAWVVHDRINPQNVPADTTEIAFSPDTLKMNGESMESVPDSLQFDVDGSPKR